MSFPNPILEKDTENKMDAILTSLILEFTWIFIYKTCCIDLFFFLILLQNNTEMTNQCPLSRAIISNNLLNMYLVCLLLKKNTRKRINWMFNDGYVTSHLTYTALIFYHGKGQYFSNIFRGYFGYSSQWHELIIKLTNTLHTEGKMSHYMWFYRLHLC